MIRSFKSMQRLSRQRGKEQREMERTKWTKRAAMQQPRQKGKQGRPAFGSFCPSVDIESATTNGAGAERSR